MDGIHTSPEEILDYWRRYYEQTPKQTRPSDFAKFVKPRLSGSVVDIGCGDGRDTEYLGAVGVDPATVGGDISDLPEADNYYARFFFHAVPEEVEDIVLSQINGTLYAESRAVGDDSFIANHYRRLISPEDFLVKIIQQGFKISYVDISHGLAVHGYNDPLIFRVVAKR